MGYTTDFEGSFTCTPALNDAQRVYLREFSETRRMDRHSNVIRGMEDPFREAVKLPAGPGGCYFVNGADEWNNPSIKDYNCPPKNQPGLWCQWIPNEEGTEIEWDGGEKFYNYIEWIKYLNEHFLKRWGIVLNGSVSWSGEDSGDVGVIVAKEGKIRFKEIERASFTFEDCEESSED